MIILNLQQGTPEWNAARAKHYTASEAPAMLGTSNYMTRNELLHQKSTGVVKDVDHNTQRLFDRGHEIEAFARPLAEAFIGSELFPVTATDDDGWLLASFDGLTMCESTAWECKTSNSRLRAAIDSGVLPDSHWPQVEQQLLISGAERCIFTISDGTEEGTRHLEYRSNPDRRRALIDGWKQFESDLHGYAPAEVKPEPAAEPQMQLPAVSVNVSGAIAVTDNLRTFGDALKAYVDRINKQPQTDDDFATLEAQAKDLKRAEDALTTAEDNALGQAADIDTLRKTVSHLREIARQARLSAEKIVKAEKENRKNAIIHAAIVSIRDFSTQIEASRFAPILPMSMPDVYADFFGVAKGLKTLSSIQNAVDTELARAKIDASSISDKIAGNLRIIQEQEEHRHLFADYRQLALKDEDDLRAVIAQRIAAYEEHEAKKKQEAEQKRLDDEASAKTVAPIVTAEIAARREQPEPPTHVNDNGARINLGGIKDRLGFTITADFLESLGFAPVDITKTAKLYRASDFPAICRALVNHIQAVSGDIRKAA